MIRDLALLTLLENVTFLLSKSTKNQELSNSLSDTLVERLLNSWINSDCRDPEMWEKLANSVSSTFHLKTSILQVKVSPLSLKMQLMISQKGTLSLCHARFSQIILPSNPFQVQRQNSTTP